MSTVKGVVQYTISKDGLLTGLWANGGPTYNEIAQKLNMEPGKEIPLEGTYKVVWLQDNAERVDATLEIKVVNPKKYYTLEWRNKQGNHMFSGHGYLLTHETLVVRYDDDPLTP